MHMPSKKHMLAALATCSLLTACGSDDNNSSDRNDEAGKVKNLILMIGDGMGAQQIGLLEEYVRRAPDSHLDTKVTSLQKFAESGRMGLSLNAPMGDRPSLVVDSACSATQLATGQGSISEAVGLDDAGNKAETILEKAKKMGKATGLVSDTRLTHATPAAFASHQPHRSKENDIAAELIDSGMVDVMLGGGSRHWVPNADDFGPMAEQLNAPSHVIKKSKRDADDERNLILDAKDAGYSLAFTKTQLNAATGTKLLGLFDDSAMNDGIEYTACQNGNDSSKCVDEPSLADMTKKALDVLSQDEDGFFLMIEGGQIDWAGHVNDTGWLLHEMLKFDEAVAAVYEWVEERNDTLVVITGDHETGGFGFSYHKHEIPDAEALAGNGMKDEPYKPQYNFGSLDTLDKIYAQSRSFYDIFDEIDGDWDFRETDPADWLTAVNNSVHADFKVDAAAAERIAARKDAKPEQIHEDHKYLSHADVPAINDFADFYVYANEDQGPLIARELAAKQSVTWGNGTHTAAPVPVYAFGPTEVTEKFSTLQHHIELGQKMIDALIVE